MTSAVIFHIINININFYQNRSRCIKKLAFLINLLGYEKNLHPFHKYFHIHHWIYSLAGLSLLYFFPTQRTWLNSTIAGLLLGNMAQGLSYSTSHYVLYDRERFEIERAQE